MEYSGQWLWLTTKKNQTGAKGRLWPIRTQKDLSQIIAIKQANMRSNKYCAFKTERNRRSNEYSARKIEHTQKDLSWIIVIKQANSRSNEYSACKIKRNRRGRFLQDCTGEVTTIITVSSNHKQLLLWACVHTRCSEIKSGHWLLEAQDRTSTLPCSLPLQVVCFCLVLWLVISVEDLTWFCCCVLCKHQEHSWLCYWVKGGLWLFLFGFFGIV